jgi:site-specific DNA recombinase
LSLLCCFGHWRGRLSPPCNSAEREVLPPLDKWLATLFAPHRLPETITALCTAQPDLDVDPTIRSAATVIEECDDKLARYRAALEAGTDPTLVARWPAEVQAQRAQALARSRHATGRRRMTTDEIQTLVEALGNIQTVLADADPQDKAEVYRQLGMQLTYEPGKQLVRAEVTLNPHSWGYGQCPRRGLRTNHPPHAR